MFTQPRRRRARRSIVLLVLGWALVPGVGRAEQGARPIVLNVQVSLGQPQVHVTPPARSYDRRPARQVRQPQPVRRPPQPVRRQPIRQDRDARSAATSNHRSQQREGRRTQIDTSLTSVERSFQRMFSTTGFRDLDAFKRAINGAGTDARKLLSKMERESFEVCIRRPEGARDGITRRGFTNFHASRRSMGDTGFMGEENIPGALRRRNTIEASYLGIATSEYQRLDSALKPKYGYMRWKKQGAQRDHLERDLDRYGKDTWIFKNSAVRERTTFVAGDSLDRVRENVPGAYQGDGRFQTFTPRRWDQSLIPWSQRAVLVPELLPAFEKGACRVPTGVKLAGWRSYLAEKGHNSLRSYSRHTFKHPLIGGNETCFYNAAPYVEAQVYKKLDLRHVKAFEFATTPPAGRFLRELQQAGVQIRDARQWPPRPWTP